MLPSVGARTELGLFEEMDFYRSVEHVFLHTPHRLVSTFSVIKAVDSPASHSKSKASPKPRTVCVTVSRRIGKPGFKATLHVLKKAASDGPSTSSAEYQIRKSYRLKHVVSLEGSQSVDDHPVCRLTFRVPGAARLKSRKDVLAYECATEEVQRELMGVVYSFCRDHEGVVPKLVGVARADLGVYGEGDESDGDSDDGDRDMLVVAQGKGGQRGGAVGHRQMGTPATPIDQNQQQTPVSAGLRTQGKAFGAQTSSIAPKQHVTRRTSTYNKVEAIRADILLDAVSDGATSLEDACKKISLERQALDDANVHELLELSGVSKRIHADILKAVSHLDDMEDAFLGFDAKLRRLSKSISVIKESSGYLKNHRSTNARDSLLDSLISMTTIDSHVEHVLETPISVKHFDRIRTAFMKLQASIEALENENQDTNQMRAVRDAKQRMKNIRAQFVFKAIEYFDGELDKAVSCGGQHVYVQLHERLAMMAPILELLCVAEASVAKERVVRYVDMTKTLLVQEAKECLETIIRVQKDEGKVASIGKQVLKAETVLLGEVKSKDAVERREVLQHIRGGDVSSAFANMMSTLVPRVANEISVLEDLVDKAALQASISSEYAADAFIDGIEPLLVDCISAVKSSRGLALLDMNGVVSTSLRKLGSGGSHAVGSVAMLSAMLHRVMEHISALWDAFEREIETAIQTRWREIRWRSANDIRVLPYVVNFEYISSRVESVIAEWAAKEGVTSVSSQPSDPSAPVAAVATTTSTVRGMADDLYARVLPEIFKTIDIFSKEHDKFKYQIQMENYAFLRTSMQALGGIKSSKILMRYSAEAAEHRDKAVRSYVSNLMTDSVLLQALVGSEQGDVTGNKEDVFADLAAFETALGYVSKAVRRDLGESSYLIRVVWGCLESRISSALDKCDGSELVDVTGARRSLAIAKSFCP